MDCIKISWSGVIICLCAHTALVPYCFPLAITVDTASGCFYQQSKIIRLLS